MIRAGSIVTAMTRNGNMFGIRVSGLGERWFTAPKSVVFISSEVEELPLVCDRILLLQHGTFSQEFHSPVNVDELMSAILSVH